MAKAPIPKPDLKILWGKSAGKCAICRCDLILEKKEGIPYPLGEMAHIQGENEGSARYNPLLNIEERSKYDNLILLCPDHHAIIDRDIEEYTVEKLRMIKKQHEDFIAVTIRANIPDVTFAELDIILKYLINVPPEVVTENLSIIPLKEKIEKNNLSLEVQNWILIGLTQIKQVRSYIQKNPDHRYSERLRKGFISKYEELYNQGLREDALFYPLWDFASNGAIEFKTKAAGLSVLVYFFELCEVFSI